MTTLIEKIAAVPMMSPLGEALRMRADILRLSDAAHDAVLLPQDPGGLSHALRAAFAARMCRHLSNAELTSHYDVYLAHSSDFDAVELAHPDGTCDEPRLNALARHIDLLTLAPKDATKEDINALKTAGIAESDIVRLAELAAFVNYQVRVVAGLKLLKDVR